MRAGFQQQAGLSVSTVLPDFDFETYSEAGFVWREDTQKWVSVSGPGKPKGISQVGAAVYAEHPTTEVLSLAYDLKDGYGPRLWKQGDADPEDLFEHVRAGGILEAHNSMFEYLIWRNVCEQRLGWPELRLTQLRCSASKARSFSLPGGLGAVAKIIGGELKHSAEGKRVINRYCIPRNPTKADPRLRILPSEEDAGTDLYSYNLQDIIAEASVSMAIPDLNETELQNWLLDQEINARGVGIDVPAVKALSKIVDDGTEYFDAFMCALTYGEVESVSKGQALLAWLAEQGVSLPNLEEGTVNDALKEPHPQHVIDVLKIRKAGTSAGVKKLQAMTKRTSADNRMRDQFVFYRAITGRFSSEGLQLQNMKSAGPTMAKSPCCGYYFPAHMKFCPMCQVMDPLGEAEEWNADIMDSTIELLCSADFKNAYQYLGDSLFEAIAASMRGMVVAPEGKELICSDYSAIEAVTLAVLAGEEWRIDVFRTHGKIYEMCAAKLTGIPFEEIVAYPGSHPVRKPYGKVPELASGYRGWIGAWLAFGADKYMDEDEIKQSILQWRKDSPMVVELWGGQWRERSEGSWTFDWDLYGLEGNAIKAVLDPGTWYTYRHISYGVHQDVLYCRLPSGRCLAYHKPEVREGKDKRSGNAQWVLSHMVNNSNPMKGRMGWIRTDTHGGVLTENVNQAVARDLQCNGMRNVAAAGYPIVAHVHDEIVAEVDKGHGDVQHFEQLMTQMPAWAHDWPVKAAGGWRGKRYRKD